MPVYDFKCKTCGNIKKNAILRITHTMEERPMCCAQTMQQHFTVPPNVVWVDPVIEPFRHVATADRPVITTTRQNREYMARNDLVDANELGPPPSQKDQMEQFAEMKESIDAISGTAEQKARLKETGMDTILEQP